MLKIKVERLNGLLYIRRTCRKGNIQGGGCEDKRVAPLPSIPMQSGSQSIQTLLIEGLQPVRHFYISLEFTWLDLLRALIATWLSVKIAMVCSFQFLSKQNEVYHHSVQNMIIYLPVRSKYVFLATMTPAPASSALLHLFSSQDKVNCAVNSH